MKAPRPKFDIPVITISRKALIWAAAALIFGSSAYGLSRTGLNISRVITEGRCRSGAFQFHSAKTSAVAADSDDDAIDNSSAREVPTQNATTSTRKIAATTGDDLIPNGSFEDADEAAPTGWKANIYGKNNAKFALVAGHNSDHAVAINITDFTEGDADWYYEPVAVKPGQYYIYKDSYRSNVATRAVLMLKDTKGNVTYTNLPKAPASIDNWGAYQASFFIPAGVTQAMVFHTLSSKGTLQIDDASMTPAQAQGFDHAMVTLTFDDGWRSIHDNALPLMQRYGIVSTQYLISGYIGESKDYMTASDVYDLRASGNEIASHTVDHLDLTKLNDKSINFELSRSKQDLGKCFAAPTDYAAPYGTYNATTTAAVTSLYQTARSTDAGFNTADNLKPYGLLVQNMTATTTQAQLTDWIQTAQRNHAWLILVYHQVDNGSSGYARHPADFEKDLQTIKSSGIAVETLNKAYNEVKSQAATK